jgi:hypothetical protein
VCKSERKELVALGGFRARSTRRLIIAQHSRECAFRYAAFSVPVFRLPHEPPLVASGSHERELHHEEEPEASPRSVAHGDGRVPETNVDPQRAAGGTANAAASRAGAGAVQVAELARLERAERLELVPGGRLGDADVFCDRERPAGGGADVVDAHTRMHPH